MALFSSQIRPQSEPPSSTSNRLGPEPCQAADCGRIATVFGEGIPVCGIHYGVLPEGYREMSRIFADKKVRMFIRLCDMAMSITPVSLDHDAWVDAIKTAGLSIGIPVEKLDVEEMTYRQKQGNKLVTVTEEEPLPRYASRVSEWFINSKKSMVNRAATARAHKALSSEAKRLTPADLIWGLADKFSFESPT